ncbi:myo-inositol-1(or 4)-monophosphatase [Sinobacterium caligoides]|uniref:Inositol-1-monophosphatase n=1 Tax=Sinobacterium caligoides TaxID=933926 RepID=A0A3N2DZ82_9GAMM|nr:inositol monophosphatase family protein [Sinobacterium caligoides]ROS05181.1 myo-inositol-1(or 4)-monophosphatase [Sinobacterium caligoides]
MQPMTKIALRAARKAGEIIERARENLEFIDVESKSENDFVTEVDKSAEREILYHLQKAYPDHCFYGEESGMIEGANKDYVWVIDPIDGTTNFVRDIPHYAISIACKVNGKVEHAVVYDPIRREEFTASRGNGAQLNGRRIRVSKATSLDGCILGTGIPFAGHTAEHLETYIESLKTLSSQSAGIRRAGAASLDLAYVAAGRLDGFWEIGLQEWDIAAGSLLVIEAGGFISDFQGGHKYLETGNIVCGPQKVFKAMLQNISPYLGQL